MQTLLEWDEVTTQKGKNHTIRVWILGSRHYQVYSKGKGRDIKQTSLILAGAQTFSWMIPVVQSGIGIGLFVVSRKSENS